MKKKQEKNLILVVLSLILGIICSEIVESVTGEIIDFGNLPQQIVALCAVVIVIFVFYSLYQLLKRFESQLPFYDKIFCSNISDKKRRIQKMIECINNAEERIYIFSDLAEEQETKIKEHSDYLKTLNKILIHNRNIDFLRIIVPPKNIDHTNYTNEMFLSDLKKLTAYREHFENIINYRRKSLLVLRNGGQKGIHIMVIDYKYLFLVFEEHYKGEVLWDVLEGGFFFEDYGKNITTHFYKCFDNIKTGNLVITKKNDNLVLI